MAEDEDETEVDDSLCPPGRSKQPSIVLDMSYVVSANVKIFGTV